MFSKPQWPFFLTETKTVVTTETKTVATNLYICKGDNAVSLHCLLNRAAGPPRSQAVARRIEVIGLSPISGRPMRKLVGYRQCSQGNRR